MLEARGSVFMLQTLKNFHQIECRWDRIGEIYQNQFSISFSNKVTGIELGVRITCRGFHLDYFHSYWWIKSVTGISPTEGKAGPALRPFSDVSSTHMKDWLHASCSWSGSQVNFYGKFGSFSCRGLSMASASSLLLLTCCMWISIKQNRWWRKGREITCPILGEIPAWIDCSLFNNLK